MSSRLAAIAPKSTIEMPPIPPIKTNSVSPPPSHKATAVAISVTALPTIVAVASRSIRFRARKEQATGPNSVLGTAAIRARTVSSTTSPPYPRAMAMATAATEEKTIVASRMTRELPINSDSSARPLAISLTR